MVWIKRRGAEYELNSGGNPYGDRIFAIGIITQKRDEYVFLQMRPLGNAQEVITKPFSIA